MTEEQRKMVEQKLWRMHELLFPGEYGLNDEDWSDKEVFETLGELVNEMLEQVTVKSKRVLSSSIEWDAIDLLVEGELRDEPLLSEELEGSTLLYEIVFDDTYRPACTDMVYRLVDGSIALLDCTSGEDIVYKTEGAKKMFIQYMEEGVIRCGG